MKPSFDFISVVLLAGAAQGMLLSLALLTIPRGNRPANRILALLLMLFAIKIALHTLAYTRHLLQLPHLAKTDAPLPFLFGPLLYLYVKALTMKEIRIGPKSLFHLLPALICAVSFISFYLQSGEEKTQHLLEEFERPCTLCVVFSWLTLIHLLIYFGAAAKLLVAHAGRMRNSFSSLAKINLNWLRNLLVVYAIDWSAVLLWQLFSQEMAAANFIWAFVSIVMYAIGYMSMRQPEIFAGADEAVAAHSAMPRKKYEKSTLAPEKAEAHHQKLLRFMATEKPFLNSALSLYGLAQKLSIPPHHLSQIINERLQQNFFEFVNRHRVEEAKKMLLDSAKANINIAGIGFEVGFSSISAFNTAFKKHTGMTPSQFRKKNL
jgi:AraC-like DNA-binding protein